MYTKAAELSQHADRQALFYVWLAHIHLQLAECTQTDDFLLRADKAYAITKQKNQDYEKFRARVQQNRTNVACG
jgi:hypothetical protein